MRRYVTIIIYFGAILIPSIFFANLYINLKDKEMQLNGLDQQVTGLKKSLRGKTDMTSRLLQKAKTAELVFDTSTQQYYATFKTDDRPYHCLWNFYGGGDLTAGKETTEQHEIDRTALWDGALDAKIDVNLACMNRLGELFIGGIPEYTAWQAAGGR